MTDHWTSGVEWNYYDFGSKDGASSLVPANVPSARETENTVVARINSRTEGADAPVISEFLLALNFDVRLGVIPSLWSFALVSLERNAFCVDSRNLGNSRTYAVHSRKIFGFARLPST